MKVLKVLVALLLAAAPLRAADHGVKGPVTGVTLTNAGTSLSGVPALDPKLSASASALLPQAAVLPSATISQPLAQIKSAAASAAVSASASTRGPPSWPSASASVSAKPGKAHKAQPGSAEALREKVLGEVERNWTLPVEELLADSDALLLGESHGSLSSYGYLTKEMARLKKAGVTAIGLEGLKQPHQEAVSRWLSEPDAAFPEQAAGFSPARKASVHALFHAAKEHGIKLVALGNPLELWAKRVVEVLGPKAQDLDTTVPPDIGDQLAMAERTYQPGYNEALSQVILTERNAVMAERMKEALGEGGKGVAIVGDAHVEHHDALSYRLFWLSLEAFGNLGEELRSRLVKAVSVTLTGGLFVQPEEGRANSRKTHAKAYELLDEVNPTGKPAFYRTSETTGLFHLGGR
jgi:hypothetical protein